MADHERPRSDIKRNPGNDHERIEQIEHERSQERGQAEERWRRQAEDLHERFESYRQDAARDWMELEQRLIRMQEKIDGVKQKIDNLKIPPSDIWPWVFLAICLLFALMIVLPYVASKGGP